MKQLANVVNLCFSELFHTFFPFDSVAAGLCCVFSAYRNKHSVGALGVGLASPLHSPFADLFLSAPFFYAPFPSCDKYFWFYPGTLAPRSFDPLGPVPFLTSYRHKKKRPSSPFPSSRLRIFLKGSLHSGPFESRSLSRPCVVWPLLDPKW